MRKTVQKNRNRSSILQTFWLPLLTAALLILLMVEVRNYLQKKDNSKPAAPVAANYHSINELQNVLQKVLNTYRLSWNPVNAQKISKETWQVTVPVDLPVPSLHLAIQERLNEIGAHILFAKSNPLSGRVSLHIGWQDSCFFVVNLDQSKNVQQEQGKIALLIDDFGDHWNGFVASFLNLGADITISVIPGREMSSTVAREMKRRGCEVILHLPMEPLNHPYHGDGYIVLTGMDRKKIREVFQRSLNDVPGAVGVNNHMGSKATADRRVMRNLLEEVKARGLYFIDSRTTASTIAYDVARELGLRCGKRDVFFDVDLREDLIKKRLWELARKSTINSFSIGIGHCHPLTLKVLRKEIPKIQAKGFRFVRLSEVVR